MSGKGKATTYNLRKILIILRNYEDLNASEVCRKSGVEYKKTVDGLCFLVSLGIIDKISIGAQRKYRIGLLYKNSLNF